MLYKIKEKLQKRPLRQFNYPSSVCPQTNTVVRFCSLSNHVFGLLTTGRYMKVHEDDTIKTRSTGKDRVNSPEFKHIFSLHQYGVLGLGYSFEHNGTVRHPHLCQLGRVRIHGFTKCFLNKSTATKYLPSLDFSYALKEEQ